MDKTEIAEKVSEIAVQLDRLESFSKVLTESVINTDLRNCDIENISYILTDAVIKIKKDYEAIEDFFEI